jgi:hypothetical protein
MSKTFTLPKDLLITTVALTEQEPCDMLYQNELTDQLIEDMENVSFKPDQSIVDRVLAYSKAVRVNASEAMVDGVVMPLN